MADKIVHYQCKDCDFVCTDADLYTDHRYKEHQRVTQDWEIKAIEYDTSEDVMRTAMEMGLDPDVNPPPSREAMDHQSKTMWAYSQAVEHVLAKLIKEGIEIGVEAPVIAAILKHQMGKVVSTFTEVAGEDMAQLIDMMAAIFTNNEKGNESNSRVVLEMAVQKVKEMQNSD